MAVGRRLGMTLSGLGLPGHFMLEYSDTNGVWILDPFHAKVGFQRGALLLPHPGLPAAGPHLSLPGSIPDRLQDVDAALFWNNLRSVYISQHRLGDALSVLNYMVIVDPEEAALWRDRGMLHFGLENMLSAGKRFEAIFPAAKPAASVYRRGRARVQRRFYRRLDARGTAGALPGGSARSLRAQADSRRNQKTELKRK